MKLKKILAGAMALVMVASSLLVAPVDTKAAPVEEGKQVAGYGWWNNVGSAKTEAVALADGDEIVWTFDVDANVGGDGAIYVIESANSTSIEGGGAFVDFSSYAGAWGDATSANTSTLTADNFTLIQAGNKYSVTLSREGSVIKAVHKNVTTDTVIIEQTATLTDTTLASSTFYMYVQFGEFTYEITKNGSPVDGSALRGHGWWNGSAAAKSTPITVVDGSKVTWTLDVNANIGGDGAIYAIESADTNGAVDFSSWWDAWGANITDMTTTIAAADYTLIQAGNTYEVTLTREGNLFTVVHKNATTNTVIATQSLKVTDCPESSTFCVYVQFGEMDCSCVVPMKSVEVSGANDKVVAGSDVQLSASVFPANTTDDYTITWTSSDNSVATVDNTGKVTGVAEGNVTITAKVSDTIVDTYDVTVQALAIPITGIDVTTDKTEIKVGTTAQLTTTVNPADTTDDKTVTYTSSDEKIAKVDANGKVTAVAPGTATITASVLDGAFKDTVEITVPVVAITDIKLTVDKTDLDKGDIVNVVATVNPADTTEDKTITWTSSNEKVATVDANGTVTAVGGGNATITATIGSVKAEVTFKVTALETVVKKSEIADFTVDAFLSVQTDGIQLKKGHTYTFTFNAKGTDAASTKLYETPSYFVYTNSENKFNTADYKELFFARGDVWCWFNADTAQNPDALPEGATFTRTYPADWDAWTATMKAGAECKLVIKYDGSTVTATYTVADASTVASFPVSIPSGSKLYLGLTGEKVELTDITVADEYVTTISGKGDVLPVLPVVLVLLGGAVVIVASKKRFA